MYLIKYFQFAERKWTDSVETNDIVKQEFS